MRVLLADERDQVRSALHVLLNQEPGITVVGQVNDTRSLLAALEATRPDVI